jgi:hypothetical protein
MRLISLRVRPPSAPTPKTATEQQPVAGNARFVTCRHAPFEPPRPGVRNHMEFHSESI